MEVRRTVPLKFDVDSDDAGLLRETADQFLWAANYVVDHARQGEYKTTSKAQLQEGTCDDVREQARLHARLVENACNNTADSHYPFRIYSPRQELEPTQQSNASATARVTAASVSETQA